MFFRSFFVLFSPLSKPKQIIIAGTPDAPDTRLMLREVHERFIPHKILILAGGGASREILTRWLPLYTAPTEQSGLGAARGLRCFSRGLPSAAAAVRLKERA